jgi:threonine aldolase
MKEIKLINFASDNYASTCPSVMDALIKANEGFASAYGDDIYTAQAADDLRSFFDWDCEVFFVFNGTAANSLALAALCQSYHSVICHGLSHIETDECGAPQFFSNGMKLLLSHEIEGKVTPKSLTHLVTKRSDLHYPKPKVLSLTFPTETGRVYSLDELRELRDCAKELGLKIHLDGARFFNGLVSLHVSPKELIKASGADVLSLGGAKNGMMFGEAVVFFDTSLAEDFEYRCKQAGQLGSKMRFMSAQWLGLLRNDTWKTNALHANSIAKYFSTEAVKIPGTSLLFPTEANSVFLEMSQTQHEKLKTSGWKYYTFIGNGARFVFSWDSKKSDVDALLNILKNA